MYTMSISIGFSPILCQTAWVHPTARNRGRLSKMQRDPAWNDLALFAAVARADGLTGAAEVTGASPATLSRRMRALEAQLGKRLFLHGKAGYRLTGDGRELMRRTERMEAAASDISRWQNAGAGPARVRISAGTWTAGLIAARLPRVWSPASSWVPEFVRSDLNLDLARREIDIGIRNRRPTQPWLAGQCTNRITYGIFAQSASVMHWIGRGADGAATAPARRVAAHHSGANSATPTGPRMSLALAQTGIGRVVLPEFVGQRTEGLVQLGARIEALTSEEWLVSHHEGRYERPVRAA